MHGSGGQVRDFVFVGDVTAHLMGAMVMLAARPGVNVCMGERTTIAGLPEGLATTLGSLRG